MPHQRDLSGTLSRNKKREHDKQPEFRGSCVIDGTAYRISGWVKDGQDGRFFSLGFSPKEQRSAWLGMQAAHDAWEASRRPEVKAIKRLSVAVSL
jgi:hypothetical protein